MEIPETKRFIPKWFELGTTLSQPNWSIKQKSGQNSGDNLKHAKTDQYFTTIPQLSHSRIQHQSNN